MTSGFNGGRFCEKRRGGLRSRRPATRRVKWVPDALSHPTDLTAMKSGRTVAWQFIGSHTVIRMDEIVFRISKDFKNLTISSLFLLAIMLIAIAVAVALEPSLHKPPFLVLWIIFSMLLIGVFVWSIAILRQIRYHVIIGPHGINRISGDGKQIAITWADVVATGDRSWMQRLRISGIGGRFLMELDWQLENAVKLEQLIHQKVYRERLVHTRTKFFHTRRYDKGFRVFPMAVFAYSLALSGFQGAYVPALFFGALTMVALVSWMNLIQGVKINSDGLQLLSMRRTESVAWSAVANVL